MYWDFKIFYPLFDKSPPFSNIAANFEIPYRYANFLWCFIQVFKTYS